MSFLSVYYYLLKISIMNSLTVNKSMKRKMKLNHNNKNFLQ